MTLEVLYTWAIYVAYPPINLFIIGVCVWGFLTTRYKSSFLILATSSLFSFGHSLSHLLYRAFDSLRLLTEDNIGWIRLVSFICEPASMLLYILGFVMLTGSLVRSGTAGTSNSP
jgi:hypothetical protein